MPAHKSRALRPLWKVFIGSLLPIICVSSIMVDAVVYAAHFPADNSDILAAAKAAPASQTQPVQQLNCNPELADENGYTITCYPGQPLPPVGTPSFVPNYTPAVAALNTGTTYSWAVAGHDYQVNGWATVMENDTTIPAYKVVMKSPNVPGWTGSSLAVTIPKGMTVKEVQLLIYTRQ